MAQVISHDGMARTHTYREVGMTGVAAAHRGCDWCGEIGRSGKLFRYWSQCESRTRVAAPLVGKPKLYCSKGCWQNA